MPPQVLLETKIHRPYHFLSSLVPSMSVFAYMFSSAVNGLNVVNTQMVV